MLVPRWNCTETRHEFSWLMGPRADKMEGSLRPRALQSKRERRSPGTDRLSATKGSQADLTEACTEVVERDGTRRLLAHPSALAARSTFSFGGSRTTGSIHVGTILGLRRAPWKSCMPAAASARHMDG